MSTRSNQKRSELIQTLFPDKVPRLWCPLVTHYNDRGDLDRERIRAHLRKLRPYVSTYLAPGSTGDGWEMSESEIDELLRFLLGEAERQDFYVMIGVLKTARGAAAAGIRSSLASLLGFSDIPSAADLRSQRVSGFTVTPPKGADLSQSEIEEDLRSVLDIGVPTALYQLPQVTENEMAPDTVARLAAEYENFYLMKDTSGRDVVATSGADTRDVFLVRGAEGEYAKWLKASGGHYDGFLLSTANSFAAELSSIISNLLDGNVQAATEISDRMFSVVGPVFEIAGDLGFGNAFTNANKAIDHHFAWGPEASERQVPMTHSGNRLSDEIVDTAGKLLIKNGFDLSSGYML